jgi:hypothetical protein
VRIQDLNLRQHSLVELMRKNQFGRVENMPIRDGQPILDSTVNVVRVARLGGDSLATKSIAGDDFELKRPVRELFDELARLENGKVIRLEFRHGLHSCLKLRQRPPVRCTRRWATGRPPSSSKPCGRRSTQERGECRHSL